MPQPDSQWFMADPVHQTLDLGSGLVKELAKKPMFQRLRRISQLGLASYVYPGAVHSRFNHCLGVAHLAGRVMDHFGALNQSGQESPHRELIECAALLHDIGHGPFSHSFERALGKVIKAAGGKEELVPHHTDWVKPLVARLRLESPELEHEIVALINEKSGANEMLPTYLRQVISSQLDVDRMDYVARDSHFSGIPTGIDLGYLIKSLRIVSHASGYQTLGLCSKGVRSYEAFAFARHTLFRSLYRHEKVAIFECMMERCLAELAGEGGKRLGITLPRFFEKLRTMAASSKSKDELMSGLIDDYCVLTEDEIWVAVSQAAARGGDDALVRLAQRLIWRDPLKGRRVRYGMGETLTRVLKEKKLAGCADVVPLKSTLYEHEPRNAERIFVVDDRSGVVRDLTECSPVVDALRDRAEIEHVLVAWEREEEVLAAASSCLDVDRAVAGSGSPANDLTAREA